MNHKHLSECYNNCRGDYMKNIVLKVESSDAISSEPGSFKERKWIIYDDLSIEYVEICDSVNNKTEKYKLTKEQYDSIINNIHLAKMNDLKVGDQCAEEWEFTECNNAIETWKRGKACIYGIVPLEEITELLKSIIG